MQSKLVHRRFPVWLQISKLVFQSTTNKIWHVIKHIGHLFYGVYLSLVIILMFPILLLGAVILSKKKLLILCSAFTRALFFLAGCRITISGKENLNKFEPIIIVTNHTSYIDVILLMAILPTNIIFIGKKELLKIPIIKTFFKKMGTISVDRLDFTQSLEDANKIKSLLEQKETLVIFPEGTFTYATGLRPFKYGAFKVAVETGSAICPIALQGTRHILREGTIIPRMGNIKVTICEPLLPKDKGWHEIVRLSANARLEIAKYCGEQAIDLVMAGVEKKN